MSEINLNEIRPGNWVHHKAEWSWRQPSTVSFKEDYMEFDFQWSCEDWAALCESTLSEEALEFIPLTPEWVRKFGFICNTGVATREFRKGEWLAVNHYENGCMVQHITWTGGVMLKYVHQLQNLYYCHEQKELEVIKKAPVLQEALDRIKAEKNGN